MKISLRYLSFTAWKRYWWRRRPGIESWITMIDIPTGEETIYFFVFSQVETRLFLWGWFSAVFCKLLSPSPTLHSIYNHMWCVSVDWFYYKPKLATASWFSVEDGWSSVMISSCEDRLGVYKHLFFHIFSSSPLLIWLSLAHRNPQHDANLAARWRRWIWTNTRCACLSGSIAVWPGGWLLYRHCSARKTIGKP